jgi:NADH-quinone oxidoreductase subunit C
MDETLKDLAEYIAAAGGAAVDSWTIERDELTITVAATDIVPLLRLLRDDARFGFVNLTDICGVDWPSREKRFDVVYHLLSPRQNARVRVKIMTDETSPVPSVTSVFAAPPRASDSY